MIKGIGHLGLFVTNIEESLSALSKIIQFEKPMFKESQKMGMKAAVVELGNIQLEFIQDYTGEGPLAQMLKEKGEHILSDL